MPIDYRIVSQRRVSIRAYSSDDPGLPSNAYQNMQLKWQLIDDLMAGTDVMRERAEMWLPREPNELLANYKNRLKRSFLYPILKDTIEKATSRPFSQPVTVTKDELDGRLVPMIDDMDGEGTDVTQQARDAYEIMAAYGIVHVYVDYPNTGGQQNAAEDRLISPVARLIMPCDLIGWRYRTNTDGKRELTQIRFRYYENVADGEWGDTEKELLLVVNAPSAEGGSGTWQRFELTASGKYNMIEQGVHTYPGIPLATAYSKKKGFMIAEPPLKDLADLNLAHWQSSSDQRNALRFARIGMIAATGISKEEYDSEMTIAPTNMFKSVNKDAKYYYVENQGGAIGAGEREIQHIEEQCEVLGAAPFVQRTANSTATGKALDRDESNSDAQAWVRIIERLYKTVFAIAAKWVKVELPDKFGVNIFDEFDSAIDGSDNDFLLKMRTSGELSRETFLSEVKRRGTLAENVEVKEEMDRIESEGPTFDQQLNQAKLEAARKGSESEGDGNGPPDGKPPAFFPPKQ